MGCRAWKTVCMPFGYHTPPTYHTGISHTTYRIPHRHHHTTHHGVLLDSVCMQPKYLYSYVPPPPPRGGTVTAWGGRFQGGVKV